MSKFRENYPKQETIDALSVVIAKGVFKYHSNEDKDWGEETAKMVYRWLRRNKDLIALALNLEKKNI